MSFIRCLFVAFFLLPSFSSLCQNMTGVYTDFKTDNKKNAEICEIILVSHLDSVIVQNGEKSQVTVHEIIANALNGFKWDSVKILVITSKQKFLSESIDKYFFVNNDDFEFRISSYKLKVKKRFFGVWVRYFNLQISYSVPAGWRLTRPILLQHL